MTIITKLEELLPIAGLADAGAIGISEFAKAMREAAAEATKATDYVNDLRSGLSEQDIVGLEQV